MTAPTSAFRWQLTDDLAAFLDRARPFLHAAPAAHTVLLTLTEQLPARPHLFGAAPPATASTNAWATARSATTRCTRSPVGRSPVDER
jgi:hypothetical protein